MDSGGIGLTGGAVGYFWGGYVPHATTNWHPVIKKGRNTILISGRNTILISSIQSGAC